ncbi:hypothetical protein D9M70_402060 [compost metagenome]
MPVAHSYVRFSSSKQLEGTSLKRQREMIAEWRTAHPQYELSNLTFEDLGLSGYKGDHLKNGFGKLLAAVEHGDIKAGDYILIEAIDRAGRLEPTKMLNILTGITSAGVKLVTLDDGLLYDNDPRNSNNLFLLVGKVQQAYNHSDTLSRRIKSVFKAKREDAAAGKGVKRRTPVWLDSDGNLIDDVAPYIVQAFEDYAAGIGERRIHHRIYQKHPLLAKLAPSTIKKWFRNPTAIGKWGDIDDVYPAVVSKELYYRVQKRLDETYKKKSFAQKYLLTGLVYCGVCGGTMGVQSYGGRSPTALLCSRRIHLGKRGCENRRSFPYHVLDYIRSQTSHSALQRAVASQTLTQSEKRIIEIDGELKELHKQSENVAKALAQYGMLPAITSQLDQIQESIRTLEAERASIPTLTAELDDVIELENDLLDDDEIKLNALLKSVGYRIVCHGESGQIVVNESSFGEGDVQEFFYKGVHRPTDSYVLESPRGVIKLPLPRNNENTGDNDTTMSNEEFAQWKKRFESAGAVVTIELAKNTEDEQGNIIVASPCKAE